MKEGGNEVVIMKRLTITPRMEYLLAEAAKPGFVRFPECVDQDISDLITHGYMEADSFGARITNAGLRRLQHDNN
jgi:hypothetical protein